MSVPSPSQDTLVVRDTGRATVVFDLLALALHLGWPLCSNDNDFEVAGVEWYTTAELLRRLGLAE